MNYKERLREYVENDDIYTEYKSGKCDMSDFDKYCIEHCKDIECLLNENEELQQENQELKRRLDYLRTGEYINQLKWERDMLQYIVENGEVQEEDKKFIDMNHRNTELLEENQKYKEVVDKLNGLADKRLLTMYFEDGGEMLVLPYSDILYILEEVG